MAPMKHFSSTFLAMALGAAACRGGGAPQTSQQSPSSAPAAEPQVTPEAPAAEKPAATPSGPAPQPRRSTSAPASPAPERHADVPKPAPPRVPEIVEITIPEGTVLEVELLTALDSAVSRAGDEIQGRTLSPVHVKGEVALPRGTYVEGKVTQAQASGRVKGKALLAFSFDRLSTKSGSRKIVTSFVEKQAESGKKRDATVIGGGAGLGALVGGIIGGKKGAAIGAGIGGASGTGVVLSTKGKEIKLPAGTEVNVRLEQPVKVLVN